MKPDFNFMDDAYENLENAFTFISPNNKVTEAMRTAIHDMIENEEPTVNLMLAYASAIVDGLKHGNWPK